MWLSKFLILAACAVLASCAPKVDPDVDAAARQAYRLIRDDDPRLQALLAEEMKTPEATAAFLKVRRLFPMEEPKAVVAVQWDIYYPFNDSDVKAEIRHAYRFEGRRAVVSTSLRRRPATRDWKVTAFNMRIATEKELEANRLTLAAKTPGHYAFLAGMILSPALIIAAVVKLIVMRGRKRRLWWILPTVIGISTLRMNWTTGAISVLPLNVELMGVGATTIPTGFDPWIVNLSIPVVAILILVGVIGASRPSAAEQPT